MPYVGTILWAKSNAAHYDHIHVEPDTRPGGVPPLKNPGMTDGVKFIYDALEARFGKSAYFLAADGETPIREVDPSVDWTHMGGWNRRYIAGTTTWSQHAWWNALDIGPLYGAEAQQEFYDFLVALKNGETPTIPTPPTPEVPPMSLPLRQAEAEANKSEVAYWCALVNFAEGRTGATLLPVDGSWPDAVTQAFAVYGPDGTMLTGKEAAAITVAAIGRGGSGGPHTHTATVSLG